MGQKQSSSIDICHEFIFKHLVQKHNYKILNLENINDFANKNVENRILRYKNLNLTLISSSIDNYDDFIRNLLLPFSTSVCLESKYHELLRDLRSNTENFAEYLTSNMTELSHTANVKENYKKYNLPFTYDHPVRAIKTGQYVLFLSYTIANFCKVLSFIVCNKYDSDRLNLKIEKVNNMLHVKKSRKISAIDIDLVCAMFLDPDFDPKINHIMENKKEGKLNIGALMLLKLLFWIEVSLDVKYVTLKCKAELFDYYHKFGFRIGINSMFDYTDLYLEENSKNKKLPDILKVIDKTHDNNLKKINNPIILGIILEIKEPDAGIGEFYNMYLDMSTITLNKLNTSLANQRIDEYIKNGSIGKMKYLDQSFTIAKEYLQELE